MTSALALLLALSWVQVSSDTYIVKSSAGQERAVRVLKELENFHQLVGTLVFRHTNLPELPIEVLLIGDEPTLQELEPVYNGRKVPVAGYYQKGNDRDFIVLSGRVFPETLTSIVYHELTHYFTSRALASQPVWLSEGLAEYFAMAEIRDEEVSLGGVSSDRLQLLKTTSLLPLRSFFAVDKKSPYYNETLKANIFYTESWAFVHYMMHGPHASEFKLYLDALTKGDADLFQFVKAGERDLDLEFQNYVRNFLSRATRTVVKLSSETWNMNVASIPDSDAQTSIAEIFLANGKFDDAEKHLESLSASVPASTRVSYYRGILARMTRDPAARDYFVDALSDPFLGPRAAVQLAGMGEQNIPTVRSLLEKASASGTRNPEVYWALANIYAEDVRRIEEAVKLAQKNSAPVAAAPAYKTQIPASDAFIHIYDHGSAQNLTYQLRSETLDQPHVKTLIPPYYPAELLEEKLPGEVVLDVQVTAEGSVGGMWLVSATPDVFGSLATAAVRQWLFEPVPAKVRIVLKFVP